MKRHFLRTTPFLALVCVSLSLAACATTTPSPPASEASTDRNAAVRGVRICVTNSTEEVAKIEWLTSKKRDSLDKNILRPGKTTCAQGYQTSLVEDDVTVKVTWPDRLAQIFTAWNQFVGTPQVRVDASKQSAAEACGFEMSGPMDQGIGIAVVCSDGFTENESRMYTAYDYHKTVLQRVGDSPDNKEFVMTLKK